MRGILEKKEEIFYPVFPTWLKTIAKIFLISRKNSSNQLYDFTMRFDFTKKIAKMNRVAHCDQIQKNVHPEK